MIGTSTDETPAERFARRAQDLFATVDAVAPDRWDDPSPCEGWTVRDVARHVVDVQGTFAGFVDRELQPFASVDDDPAQAVRSSVSQVLALLEDPAVAQQPHTGVFGASTFEATTDRFASVDLVIHRWDLGTGAGVPVALDERDVAACLADVDALPPDLREMMRTAGAFGPELTPPEGADAQTRLLATLGRKAW